MTADDRPKKAWQISGALVPAGLFIGMGVSAGCSVTWSPAFS